MPDAPLQMGAEVYDFSALAHNGQRFKLSRFLERPALVYFCPEDKAQACRDLALNLRDNWLSLAPSVSMAFGVTPEDTFIHRDFASEHELPHLLVADADARVHQVFGLNVGAFVSYLIGPERKVLAVFSPPNSTQHSEQILDALGRLGLVQPPRPL